jgi:hypothetical protein
MAVRLGVRASDEVSKISEPQDASLPVEPPQEHITGVNALREQIRVIKAQKQPRLTVLHATIEQARTKLLDDLGNGDATLSAKRPSKAKELTDALDGKIKIEVKPSADREAYLRMLTELCGEIAAHDSQIKNKDSQLLRLFPSSHHYN